ncbi:LOW QUALITY PROTEIN: hypothetical protein U9M48_005302 [Paspalum notatum var. saurae]|uniref:SWIM-type domain-containing protein n=1 Tax=Paspalum notatum var. saurae TaxID=547442 RepID=A0AAQ3PWL9_PASNO
MYDFRLAVKQHAIENEFELRTEHSTQKGLGVPAKLMDVQINTLKHQCSSKCRLEGTMASQAWVAERAIPLLKRKHNIGAKEVQEALQDKYKININYQTVYYGTQRAADKLFGKWDDSWDWLYRFKAEVELRSPGSVRDTVQDGDKVRFSRFFCAYKACIDRFLNGCRPYHSIDSTALNGQWNGHMPAAMALDGHNWMFPLAFGFFDSETKDNWIWFMQQLSKSIGPVPKLAICTDACKGLETAVAKVFPWAEQRECFRHLMENMKKYYTGEIYGKNIWPAARAYTSGKFNYFMGKVLEASPGVADWLNDNHNLMWARSKFSTDIKVDYINNNLAECWNGWIKEFKDLPIHCMVDAIRVKLVVLFEKRRISMALQGCILPGVIHQLNAASKGLGHLKVTKGNPNQSEVTEIYKDEEVRRHVVYLKKRSCTCREWDVTGKPCPYALAVITSARSSNMEEYVDMAYSVQKFRAAYAGVIPNITDRTQWPVAEKGFKLHPPHAKKRGVGRQRKNRIPSFLERNGKATRQVKCKGCGEYGHRSGSWRCSLTGTKKYEEAKKKNPAKRGRKKAKTAEEASTSHAATHEIIPVTATPRTRAAATRERAAAAAAAAQAAETAAAQAEAAVAAQAEGPVAAQAETRVGPSTRRRLAMDQPVPVLCLPPMPKKMTPVKKRVCTKSTIPLIKVAVFIQLHGP